MLKRGQFTFSMPRDGLPFSADLTSFAQPLPSSPTQQSNFSVPSGVKSPKLTNPLDWSSMTTFDPSRLNLLDDIAPSQTTATDSAMQLDFGFGSTGLASNTPYTTLTSNPMFMSFASSFDATSPPNDNSPNLSTSTNQPFDFDLNSLTAWPSPQNGQEGSFDDLLQGYIGGNNNNNGGLGSFLTSPASVSPVAHHVSPSGLRTVSSSSSPSSSSTDPLFTPKDTSPEADHPHDECPKTRAELAKRIEESGPSPFAPACNPAVRKSSDGVLAMISCEGATSFPKTQKSENNIEVLSAWRSITSNPKFKVRLPGRICQKGH
jgi:AP-1-like factor